VFASDSLQTPIGITNHIGEKLKHFVNFRDKQVLQLTM